MSDEVLSMDAAALEEDLAMLAGSPHNSGSWDSATLARAGQGKTLWIGEYHLVHWCLFCQYLFGIYSVKVISTEKWCLE